MAGESKARSAEQAELAARVRALLPGEPEVREVSMFGELVFMLRERALVSAGRDGSLLVRTDPDRSPELRERPGAAQALMRTGRPMGPGWIRVEPGALQGEGALIAWVEEARDWRARSEVAGEGA